MKNELQTVECKSRKEWRAWLKKNHQAEKAVWLTIYHKKSTVKSIYYDHAVEEALCFGWVDSKGKKRDDESFYLFFAQRKPKSNWSKPNRERVEKLIKQKLMTPAGQAMIDLAKKAGTWEALMEIENGVIPPDLQRLFNKNKIAFNNFLAFAPSSRKMILQWILSAKRPETREKRIQETVALAARNIKAHH